MLGDVKSVSCLGGTQTDTDMDRTTKKILTEWLWPKIMAGIQLLVNAWVACLAAKPSSLVSNKN